MSDEISAVELAAELTAALLANPNTRTGADDVPAFLISMHAAVAKLSGDGFSLCGRAGSDIRASSHRAQIAVFP